jgi:hypothetical protein
MDTSLVQSSSTYIQETLFETDVMGRYPRAARLSRIKCIAYNAPTTETTTGEHICVECGDSPVTEK